MVPKLCLLCLLVTVIRKKLTSVSLLDICVKSVFYHIIWGKYLDDQAKVPYFLCSVDNTFQAFSVYSTGDSREFERSSRPVAVL